MECIFEAGIVQNQLNNHGSFDNMPLRSYFVFVSSSIVLFCLSQFVKAQYINPKVWKENVHRFSAFKDRRGLFKTLFTLLYGSCEVLGGESYTETTTEVSIIVTTGKT